LKACSPSAASTSITPRSNAGRSLAYASMIEKRPRRFRQPHCGSIRGNETYVKIRGEWRYLYRAVDKHGTPVDFLLTARRALAVAKRFFRKSLKDQPLLSPGEMGTDGANVYPAAIQTGIDQGRLTTAVVHRVTKHLQQVIESGHELRAILTGHRV
jgi:transposase-like protein